MRNRLLWERLNGRRGLSTLSFCVEIGPESEGTTPPSDNKFV